MGSKGPKREVPPSKFRDVIAANLEHLMKANAELNSSPKLEERSGVARASINRIRRKEVGAGIDSLDALAAAFDLQPWQLLIPGMNPKNPPVIAGLTERERALYRRFAEAAADLALINPGTGGADPALQAMEPDLPPTSEYRSTVATPTEKSPPAGKRHKT